MTEVWEAIKLVRWVEEDRWVEEVRVQGYPDIREI
jgi:hypothetical protein